MLEKLPAGASKASLNSEEQFLSQEPQTDELLEAAPCLPSHLPTLSLLCGMPRTKIPDDVKQWIKGQGKDWLRNWLQQGCDSQISRDSETQETLPASPTALAEMGRHPLPDVWPHDRQPTGFESQADMNKAPVDDAVKILEEELPEPRHIPAWAWPVIRGTKRVFLWESQDSLHKRQKHEDPSPGKPPAEEVATSSNESLACPNLAMLWMLWQCFSMCCWLTSRFQERDIKSPNALHDLPAADARLSSGTNEAMEAGVALPPPPPINPSQDHGQGDIVPWRRRLRPMPTGQLPKVQEILALASKHGLYKDASQFKWLDASIRAFQLRTPCQRACINFYALSGSMYITGLDKFAGIDYVKEWTNIDKRQPRKRRSKYGRGPGGNQLQPPLTPEQAISFLGS